MYLPLREGFLPFEEARELVRKEGLKSANNGGFGAETDTALPTYPPLQADPRRQGVSWADWLGCGKQP